MSLRVINEAFALDLLVRIRFFSKSPSLSSTEVVF